MTKEKKIINFIERFGSHVKGSLAGKPFLLEEWQKDYIMELFGNVDSRGLRNYRTSFVFIPRKNGKSNLIAALALAILLLDEEPGAEIYCCASSREQANAIFTVASQMVRQNAFLSKKLTVTKNAIVLNGTISFIKAVAAEAGVLHGANPHAVLYDEVHTAKNRDLWDVMESGQGAREQPLMFGISTAGKFDPQHICYEQYDYAKKVAAGIIDDPSYLPLIFEAPEDLDPFDEETWRIANPNYGVSVRPEFLKKEAAKARSSAARELTFRQLYLNQWVSDLSGWVSDIDYMAAQSEFEEEDLLDRVAYGGLDLGPKGDLTSIALYFPETDSQPAYVLTRCYTSEANIRRRRDDAGLDFDEFVKKGELIVHPGSVVNYSRVKDDIQNLFEKFRIEMMAYDSFSASLLVAELEKDSGITMAKYRQGYISMNPPIRHLEGLIQEHRLQHNKDSFLRWQLNNIVVRQDDAGNVKFSKDKSADKIDSWVAVAMACGVYLTTLFDEQEQESVYEARGVRRL